MATPLAFEPVTPCEYCLSPPFKLSISNALLKNSHFCRFSSTTSVSITKDSVTIYLMPKPKLAEATAKESQREQVARLCREGRFQKAVAIFERIRKRPITFDTDTYVCLLKGCSSVRACRNIHQHIIESGVERNGLLGFMLIAAYLRLGNMEFACHVFEEMTEKETRSWNALAAGLVKHGRGKDALRVFCDMRNKGIPVDAYSLSNVLKACASPETPGMGEQVHALVFSMGLQNNDYVAAALINMYAKSARIDSARRVFETIAQRSVVVWNAMIAGYAQHGFSEESLRLCREMVAAGVRPDHFTFSTVVRVCSGRAMLGPGKQVHGAVLRHGFKLDVVLGTALVDLYSKWGSLENALTVLHGMPRKNLLTWNAALGGFRNHGRGKEAMDFMKKMQQQGVRPNFITLFSVMMACCNQGLLDEGSRYFDVLRSEFRISPQAMHYACLVEIFGRKGQLYDALAFVRRLKIKPMGALWWPLLSACRVHGNWDLGRLAAKHLLETQPQHTIRTYRALLDVCVSASRWEDAAATRRTLKKLGEEGPCSWIESKGRVHVFSAGEIRHPLLDKIYMLLEKMASRLSTKDKESYAESRKLFSCEHEGLPFYFSEELAIAFGLLSSPDSSSSINIFQNHLMSVPCHSAVKIISTVIDRKIVVRDSWRFHHFQNGVCSCEDYW